MFAKALFLKSFLVCNFWKIWFWFFLTDQCVEHILTFIKHTYGVQKDAEQNFDTYEDPIWAINHNLKTFFESSKPVVLFVSNTSLIGHLLLFGWSKREFQIDDTWPNHFCKGTQFCRYLIWLIFDRLHGVILDQISKIEGALEYIRNCRSETPYCRWKCFLFSGKRPKLNSEKLKCHWINSPQIKTCTLDWFFE